MAAPAVDSQARLAQRHAVLTQVYQMMEPDTILYYTLGEGEVTADRFSNVDSYVDPLAAYPAAAPSDPIHRFLYEYNASHAIFCRKLHTAAKMKWDKPRTPDGLFGPVYVMIQGSGWYVRSDNHEKTTDGRSRKVGLLEPEQEAVPCLLEGSHTQTLCIFNDPTADFTAKTVQSTAPPVLVVLYTTPKRSLYRQAENLRAAFILGHSPVHQSMLDDTQDLDFKGDTDEADDVDPKTKVSLSMLEAELQIYKSQIKSIPGSVVEPKNRKQAGQTPLEYLTNKQGDPGVPETLLADVMGHLTRGYLTQTISEAQLMSFTDRMLKNRCTVDLSKIDFKDEDAIPSLVEKLLEEVVVTEVTLDARLVREYFSVHSPRPSPKVEAKLAQSIVYRWMLRHYWLGGMAEHNTYGSFEAEDRYDHRHALNVLNPGFARRTPKMMTRMSEPHRRAMVCALLELAALLNQRTSDKWPKVIHTFLQTIPLPLFDKAAGFLKRNGARELLKWLVTWNTTTYTLVSHLISTPAEPAGGGIKKHLQAKSKKKTKPKKTDSDAENMDDDDDDAAAAEAKEDDDSSADEAPAPVVVKKEKVKKEEKPKKKKRKAPESSSAGGGDEDENREGKKKKKKKKNDGHAEPLVKRAVSASSTVLQPVALANASKRLGLSSTERSYEVFSDVWMKKLPASRIGRMFDVAPTVSVPDRCKHLFLPAIDSLGLKDVAPVELDNGLYLYHRFDEQGQYRALLFPLHPYTQLTKNSELGVTGFVLVTTAEMYFQATLKVTVAAAEVVQTTVHDVFCSSDEDL